MDTTFQVVKKLYKAAHKQMLWVVLWQLAAILASIALLASAFFAAGVMQQTADAGTDRLYRPYVLLAIATLSMAGLNTAKALLAVRAYEKCALAVRIFATSNLIGIKNEDMSMLKEGDILSRSTRDLDHAIYLCFSQLPNLFADLINIAITMGCLFAVHWSLFVLYVVLIPIILYLNISSGTSLQKHYAKASEMNGELTAIANEYMKHPIDIKMHESGLFNARFDDAAKKYIAQKKYNARKGAKLMPIGFIAGALPIVCLAACSAALVMRQAIAINDLLFVLLITQPVNQMIMVLNQRFAAVRQSIADCARVSSLWSLQAKRAAVPSPVQEKHESACILQFDNVTFGYADNENILENFSFSLMKGDICALVGPNGCGKTTIMKLATGAISPKKGVVRIGGAPMCPPNENDLLKRVGVVSQEVFLFNDTLENNILCGKLDATGDEVMAACETAGLLDIVHSGLRMRIGENGSFLSGGQRQRVALARALIRKAPLVLLDEHTSAQDALTEHEIHKALLQMKAYAGILIISHRKSVLPYASRMITPPFYSEEVAHETSNR